MINKDNILALIPARSGSKGLKNKNIKIFKDKPLIAWTIESALKSKYLNDVFVSSDSKKIINISKKFGAKIPFVRPKNLSDDKSKSIDVILHALNHINKNHKYKYILLLQPTSPLRNNKDIDKIIEEFFKRTNKIVLSVKKMSHPSSWLLKINKKNKIINYKNLLVTKNRQDYATSFIPNGAMYLAEIKYLIKHKSFYTNDTSIFEMPYDKSIDIDELIDFKIAEFLMK